MESSDEILAILQLGLAALIKESPHGFVSVSSEWFGKDKVMELAKYSIAIDPRDNGNVYYTLQENE